MKLEWKIKYALTSYLKDLQKNKEYLEIITILKNLLDENQTDASLKKDLDTLNQLIDSKNPQSLDASFILGVCYRHGIGVVKDEKRAVKFYQFAANKNHAYAQNNLGFYYERGIGVDKDEERALVLYQLAANQGEAGGQNNLGMCYQSGFVVAEDAKRAVELYQLVANQGEAGGQNNLAVCYNDAIGIAKDVKRAILLFQAAAQQGYNIAIKSLADIYANSIHVFPNLNDALAHYQKLAFEDKDISSLTTLAFCYQMALGTEKNLKTAIELYQQAIQQGENCYRDLFTCYQNQHAMGMNVDNVLKDFYDKLKRKAAEKDSNAASLLAYLYEYGAPKLDQNLYTALYYYDIVNQDIHTILIHTISLDFDIFKAIKNSEYSNNKIQYYTPLLNLKTVCQEACQEVLNKNLSSIIAEYAFEENKPNEENKSNEQNKPNFFIKKTIN